MQLFITDFQQNGSKIILTNPEIIAQIRKVLRMKIQDKIFLQTQESLFTTRYQAVIESRNDKDILCEIVNQEIHENSDMEKTMIICMSNKREKAEIITQKLTEIGIQNIVFRPSERSVIKDRNEKKSERIYKISKEAVEQSRGRTLPKIIFTKNISEIVKNQEIDIFDIPREGLSFDEGTEYKNIGLIGPEGGLTDLDYINIQSENISIKSLGNNVLRMETAAIVAGRLLKNY